MPTARPLTAKQVAAKLPGSRVLRNPWSRAAWSRHGRSAELFVAGESFACSMALARLLAGNRELSGDDVARCADAAGLSMLARLINAGHLRLVRRR
jgi:50S ribosomal protein L16 3-hydroxylase